MLNCAQCHHTIIYADHLVYREFGDFVIDCPTCTAHNVIVPLTDDDKSQPALLLAITGYHSVA